MLIVLVLMVVDLCAHLKPVVFEAVLSQPIQMRSTTLPIGYSNSNRQILCGSGNCVGSRDLFSFLFEFWKCVVFGTQCNFCSHSIVCSEGVSFSYF